VSSKWKFFLLFFSPSNYFGFLCHSLYVEIGHSVSSDAKDGIWAGHLNSIFCIRTIGLDKKKKKKKKERKKKNNNNKP